MKLLKIPHMRCILLLLKIFLFIIVQLFSLLVLHISIFREHAGFLSSRMKQVNYD